MQRRTRWFAVLMLGVALPLSACAQAASSEPESESAATVEQINDEGLNRLTLTDRAVERLAIETAEVTEERTVSGDTETVTTVIPYAALLYQPDGATFVYTNTEPATYVREPVSVQEIVGDRVLLTAGPATGVQVVTTGAAELWGAEFKIGKY